jgi:hypothetical protein
MRGIYEYFSKKRKAEEKFPAGTYEVQKGSKLPGTQRAVCCMFNPASNRQEEVPYNPKAEGDDSGPFLRAFSGFSRRDAHIALRSL